MRSSKKVLAAFRVSAKNLTLAMNEPGSLSRRERQIMEIIYGQGEATATQVLQALPDPPTRTSVRTLLRILEDKGHLKHRQAGREFVFFPARPKEGVAKSAFRRLLATFFEGSLEKAVAAHLSDPGAEVRPEELKRIAAMIAKAKKEEGE